MLSYPLEWPIKLRSILWKNWGHLKFDVKIEDKIPRVHWQHILDVNGCRSFWKTITLPPACLLSQTPRAVSAWMCLARDGIRKASHNKKISVIQSKLLGKISKLFNDFLFPYSILFKSIFSSQN